MEFILGILWKFCHRQAGPGPGVAGCPAPGTDGAVPDVGPPERPERAGLHPPGLPAPRDRVSAGSG